MAHDNGSQTHSCYAGATSETYALGETVRLQRIRSGSNCHWILYERKRPKNTSYKPKTVVCKKMNQTFDL